MLILIVEDNVDLAFGLQKNFEFEGYEVQHAGSLAEATAMLDRCPPHLIVLDLMLPDGDGMDFLEERRKNGDHTPVIILSARVAEEDRVRGLRLGADDYVPKPFAVLELLERVRLRLKAHQLNTRQIYTSHCRIELDQQAVYRDNIRIPLTRQETRIITALIRNEGQTVPRERLLKEIWELSSESHTRRLDFFITSLRKKIEINPKRPQHILTDHGRGYRFVIRS